MAIPNNINLNLGTSYPGTILDQNGVGTGFTDVVLTSGGLAELASSLTVNTATGLLEVIPNGGGYNTGLTRNFLAVNVDTSLSYTTYVKIPLAPLRAYPVTSANVLAGPSVCVANTMDNILRVILDIYLVSGTTYGWRFYAQSKVNTTISAIGSNQQVTSSVANAANDYVEIYLHFNGITKEFSYQYKFETEARQTVNLGVLSDSTLSSDIIGVNRKVGMLWRRSVATGFRSTKMDTDTFSVTYTQAEITGTAASRRSTLTGSSNVSAPAINITGTAASRSSTLSGSSNVNAPAINITGTAVSRRATLTGTSTVKYQNQITGTVVSRRASLTGTSIVKYLNQLTGTAASRRATLTGSSDISTPGVNITGTVASRRATLTGTSIVKYLNQLTGTAASRRATLTGTSIVKYLNQLTGTAASRRATLTGASTVKYQNQITGAVASRRATLTGSSNVSTPGVNITGTVASRRATLTGTSIVKYLNQLTGTAASRRSTLTGSNNVSTPGISITGTAASRRSTLTGSSNVSRSPIAITGTAASRRATLFNGELALDEPNVFTVPANLNLALGTTYPGTLLDKDNLGTGFTHVLPSTGHLPANLDIDAVEGLTVTPNGGLLSTATLKNILALNIDATNNFTIKATFNLADLREWNPTLSANNTTLVGIAHSNSDFSYVVRANFEIMLVGSTYKWMFKLSGKSPSSSNTFTINHEIGTLISNTSNSTVDVTLSYNPSTNWYSATYKANNRNTITHANFRQLTQTEIDNLGGANNSYAALLIKKPNNTTSQTIPTRVKNFNVAYNNVQFRGTLQAQRAKTLSFAAINEIKLTGTVTPQRSITLAQLAKTFLHSITGTVNSQRGDTFTSVVRLGVRLVGNLASRSSKLQGVLSPSSITNITGNVVSRRSTISANLIPGKVIGGTLKAQSATTAIVLTFSEVFKSSNLNAKAQSAIVSGVLGLKSTLLVGGSVKAQSSTVLNVDNPFMNEFNMRVKSFFFVNIAANSQSSALAIDSALKINSYFTVTGTAKARRPNLSGLFAVSPIYLDFSQEADIIIYNQTENAVLFYAEPQSGIQVTESTGAIL